MDMDMFESGLEDLNKLIDPENENKFSKINSKFGGIYGYDFAKSLRDKFEEHIEEDYVFETLSSIAEFVSQLQKVINDNFTLPEKKEKSEAIKVDIGEILINSDDYETTLDDVKKYIELQTKDPQENVESSENIFTVEENLFDEASVNEEVLSDDKTNEFKDVFVDLDDYEELEPLNDASVDEEVLPSNEASVNEDELSDNEFVHHPLWYVLNHINEEDSLNVDVKEDENSSDVHNFNGKEVKIGDASNITFRNDNDAIGTKVSMTKADNNMTISHQKDSAVVNGSVKSSVLGLLDYMSESKQSPFVFCLNTKTEEFKKTLVEELISLKNLDMALKNENDNDKSFVLKDKVDVFSFDGKVIPFSTFESFDNYEAFDNYVKAEELKEKIKVKQKAEELHSMADSLKKDENESNNVDPTKQDETDDLKDEINIVDLLSQKGRD